MVDGLVDILEDLKDVNEGDATSIGEVLTAFENRSLGVVLTMLVLIAAVPLIGGMPGMSLLTGTLVLVAIVQSLFMGGGGLWAPAWIRSIEIGAGKFGAAVDRVKPYAERIDGCLLPRLRFLANRWTISLCTFLLALTFYPIAVMPYG